MLTALAAVALAAPALAGPPSAVVRAVQAAAGSVALAPGAIRFTAIQPGNRGATIYEARRGADGVSRTIIDLTPTGGGAAIRPEGWAVDARDTKVMAAETLDYFAGRIDAALAAAPADVICTDGPDYYSEHGAAGLAGGCGTDHPNAAIARALGLADPVAP